MKTPKFTDHPDVPLINIHNYNRYNRACLSKTAVVKAGIEIGCFAAFASRKGKLCFAVLPFDSKITGHKVYTEHNNLACVSKNIMNEPIENGCYQLLDPIYCAGIDWFPMEKFEIETTTDN